jgi:5-carboxymethyl-2-hydroxymuconate isomerase
MPHITIECSGNVDTLLLDDIPRVVHAAAIATGVAPLDALRTRLVVHDRYVIADQRPENKFIAVTARLGAGRTVADKQRLASAVMDAIVSHLGAAERDTALSVECQDIDPTTRINRNNLTARSEPG